MQPCYVYPCPIIVYKFYHPAFFPGPHAALPHLFALVPMYTNTSIAKQVLLCLLHGRQNIQCPAYGRVSRTNAGSSCRSFKHCHSSDKSFIVTSCKSHFRAVAVGK